MNFLATAQTVLDFDLIKLPAILGLCLLTGYAGLFSFGHAGFMAIGAYISAYLTVNAGWPFFPAVLAGAGFAALIAWLLGSMTLKLKGDYFCIATMGFGEAIRLLLDNMDFFGGARGFQGIAHYTNTWILLAVNIVLVALLAFLVQSRHGRNMVAIREEELAAQMAGVDVFRYKMIALVFSAVYAAIAGGLYSHYMTSIQPKNFRMDISTEITIVVILGGIGSISGSVLAALILLSLPQVILQFETWRFVAYGALVVVVMIARPQGLMGGFELTPGGVRRWATARRLRRESARADAAREGA